MPWCPYPPGGRIKSAVRKKKKAHKEEEDRKGRKTGGETCVVGGGKIYSMDIYSIRAKTDLK